MQKWAATTCSIPTTYDFNDSYIYVIDCMDSPLCNNPFCSFNL